MGNNGPLPFNQKVSSLVLAGSPDVFTKLRQQKYVTSQEADQIADWVVSETRSVLLRVLTQEKATTAMQFNAAVDISKEPLHGRCSFSQCVAAYGLIDRGLNPKPFSAQSLPGHTVGHAMLALEIPTEESSSVYLIDPTFRQFYDPQVPESEGHPMPGYVLEKMEGGSELLQGLLHKGYVKMDADKADKYLSAFCKGHSPFASQEQAFTFLKDPPYDNAYHWFNRESMKKGGYLIPESKGLS